MAYKSKGFLGDGNIGAFKLGDSDVRLYLGDTLVYPLECEDSVQWEVDNVSYPSNIEWNDTSFVLSFDYEKTHIDSSCTVTVETGEESETIVTSYNPSTSSTRNVSGNYVFEGVSIPYSVTQGYVIPNLFASFSGTGDIRVVGSTDDIYGVAIAGSMQSSVTTSYRITRSGTYTVGYAVGDLTTLPSFSNCNYMTSIEIPDTVQTLPARVFYYCQRLTGITIPDSVTGAIGDESFNQDHALTYCNIGNGITSIGTSCFSVCRNLTNVTFGDSIEIIGVNAFQGCYSLTSIDIPDSVTSIGNGGFAGCSGMTTCTIGSGITSIGINAFNGCSGLTSITVNAVTPPTLVNVNAFRYTNNCQIYVPCDSVNAYKAASNWSTYASRIQAIPGSCP